MHGYVCVSVNGTQWFWQDSMFTISFLLVYLRVHLVVALVLGGWFIVVRNKGSLSWLSTGAKELLLCLWFLMCKCVRFLFCFAFKDESLGKETGKRKLILKIKLHCNKNKTCMFLTLISFRYISLSESVK